MENFSRIGKEEDQMDLPPGFRFHPTDEELITHYLSKKVVDSNFSARAIGEVDLNMVEPWDLPSKFPNSIVSFFITSSFWLLLFSESVLQIIFKKNCLVTDLKLVFLGIYRKNETLFLEKLKRKPSNRQKSFRIKINCM